MQHGSSCAEKKKSENKECEILSCFQRRAMVVIMEGLVPLDSPPGSKLETFVYPFSCLATTTHMSNNTTSTCFYHQPCRHHHTLILRPNGDKGLKTHLKPLVVRETTRRLYVLSFSLSFSLLTYIYNKIVSSIIWILLRLSGSQRRQLSFYLRRG